MKTSSCVITILLVMCGACAADAVKLEPNAKLTFEFPDLPETFYAKSTGDKRPAMLTAQLPENYSREGKFPIFVFINGGSGGRGDTLTARNIAGPRDFIAVSLPLFKDRPVERPSPLPGIKIDVTKMIMADDGALLAKSYRVMLQKLFDAVPNIAAERSVIGGFSNGGHATSALITARDEFILTHFTAYLFYEGGVALALDLDVLNQPALKHSRFLLLLGDQADMAGRKLLMPLVESLEARAKKNELDFTRIVMRGYGHQMPAEYSALVGNWVRGEKLPEIGAK